MGIILGQYSQSDAFSATSSHQMRSLSWQEYIYSPIIADKRAPTPPLSIRPQLKKLLEDLKTKYLNGLKQTSFKRNQMASNQCQ